MKSSTARIVLATPTQSVPHRAFSARHHSRLWLQKLELDAVVEAAHGAQDT
jgi:hypothetical protein